MAKGRISTGISTSKAADGGAGPVSRISILQLNYTTLLHFITTRTTARQTVQTNETFRRHAGVQRTRDAAAGGCESACRSAGHRIDLRGRRIDGRLPRAAGAIAGGVSADSNPASAEEHGERCGAAPRYQGSYRRLRHHSGCRSRVRPGRVHGDAGTADRRACRCGLRLALSFRAPASRTLLLAFRRQLDSYSALE